MDEHLLKPATKGDLILLNGLLEDLSSKLLEVKDCVENRLFYSVTEFAQKTGLDQTTIIVYCNKRLLKATQIKKGSAWLIYKEELNRLKSEAEMNHDSELKFSTKRNNLLNKKMKK